MTDPSLPQRYLDEVAARSAGVRQLFEQSGANGESLAPFVEYRVFEPGAVMIEQGSRPKELLLLLGGECEATDKGRGMGGARLRAPDVVGEISMVTKLPAIANVIAISGVRALSLSHVALAELMGASPGAALALMRSFAENVVDKMVRGGEANELSVGTPVADQPFHGTSLRHGGVVAQLRDMRAFQWTDAEVTSGVADLFLVRHPRVSERFIQNGEQSDSLFLLADGTARVDTLDGPVSAFVSGHAFCEHVLMGELSFLTGRPRTGNVIAVTDCELLELSSTRLAEMARVSPGFTGRLLLGILRAVCRKLVDTAATRARYEAVIGGDWKEWFVDDDDFTRRWGS